MPLDTVMAGALAPELAHEAVRLFLEMFRGLHAVTTTPAGDVVFAFAARPQLADDLSAFGASREDDEGDGAAEADGRRLETFTEALLAPAPRQGGPVPAWSGPPAAVPAPFEPRPLPPGTLERWAKIYGFNLATLAAAEPETV